MKKIITCLMCIMIITITSSCDKKTGFTFDAKLQDITEVKIDEPFVITVTTTNSTGEDYHYDGSSTVVGAIIYLSSNINGEKIIFRPNDVPVTKDFRHMTFKKGDKIERDWTFEYFNDVKPGSYDLNFEFFDVKYTIKDFVKIT